MGNLDLIFESLVDELKIMINNISDLGINTKKYKEELNNIINDVHSNVEESKKKWENNANMFLEIDYNAGIKKLNHLKLELNDYNIYFKAVNTCKCLILEFDDIENLKDGEKIKHYAEIIIELLKDIKLSNITYDKKKKAILKGIYDIVYEIIKLEIIKLGKSRVYEYVKDDDIDTSFLEKCVRKEVETLNLDVKKYENVKKKVYEINSDGLTSNYFDIDLIKSLIICSNNIDLKEDIVNELKDLKKEINNNVLNFKNGMSELKKSKKSFQKIKSKFNQAKIVILLNVLSFVMVIPIMFYSSGKSRENIKKYFVNEVYPRTITTYSKEYGLKQEKDYVSSYSINDNKIYIK